MQFVRRGLVARRERREVVEDDGDDEEESRERETLATLRSAPEGRNIPTDFVPKIFKENKIQLNALLTTV